MWLISKSSIEINSLIFYHIIDTIICDLEDVNGGLWNMLMEITLKNLSLSRTVILHLCGTILSFSCFV